SHVTGLLKERIPEIRTKGEVEVTLAGRPFRIRREFLDDVSKQRLEDKVGKLHKALLGLHARGDDIVGIANASHIFLAAKHPKSFVSLADADHLLSKPRDDAYVADVIAAWSERYLDMEGATEVAATEPGTVVVRETRAGKFQQEIRAGRHALIADEPVDVGGLNSG